jgi:hypothetical protein
MPVKNSSSSSNISFPPLTVFPPVQVIPPKQEPINSSSSSNFFSVPPSFSKKVDENKSILTAPPPKTFERPFVERVKIFRNNLKNYIKEKVSKQKTVKPFIINIKADKKDFVQSSFNEFDNASPVDYFRELIVNYVGREKNDYNNNIGNGGVKKEWFGNIISSITNPSYALFSTDIANENRISISHLATVGQSYAEQFYRFFFFFFFF